MITTNLYNFRLLSVFVLLFLTSCGGNETPTIDVEKPDNLISEKKMVEIMIETQILEAKIVDKRMSEKEAISTFNKFEKVIFEQNGVDSALYYSSYNYYLGNLETFKNMITAVSDTLLHKKEAQQALEADK